MIGSIARTAKLAPRLGRLLSALLMLCVSALIGAGQARAVDRTLLDSGSTSLPEPMERPAPEAAEVQLTMDEALDKVPAEAVESYVKRFDVPSAEAERRIAVQIVSPGVRERLRDSLGNGLTDVWFDNRAGEIVVATTKDVAPERLDALMGQQQLAGSYRVEIASFEFDEMVAVAERLRIDLSDLFAKGDVIVSWGAGRVEIEQSASIGAADLRTVDEAVAGARERSSVTITRTTGRDTLATVPALSCSFPFCDRLLGGVKWEPSTQNGYCTTSVPADLAGYRVLLTAGHCVSAYGNGLAVGSRTSPTGAYKPIGNIYLGFNDANGDWGWILPSSPWPSAFGSGPILGWFNWQPAPATSESTQYARLTSTVPYGYVVCHNGATTGTNCGYATGVSGPFQWSVSQFNCGGDSGGEVHQPGGGAVGIDVFRNDPWGNQCGNEMGFTTLMSIKSWANSAGYTFTIPLAI